MTHPPHRHTVLFFSFQHQFFDLFPFFILFLFRFFAPPPIVYAHAYCFQLINIMPNVKIMTSVEHQTQPGSNSLSSEFFNGEKGGGIWFEIHCRFITLAHATFFTMDFFTHSKPSFRFFVEFIIGRINEPIRNEDENSATYIRHNWVKAALSYRRAS